MDKDLEYEKTIFYKVISCMDKRLYNCIVIDVIEYSGLIVAYNQSIKVRDLKLKRSGEVIEKADFNEAIKNIIGKKKSIEDSDIQELTKEISYIMNTQEDEEKQTKFICRKEISKYCEGFIGIFLMIDIIQYQEILNLKQEDDNFFMYFFIRNLFRDIFIEEKYNNKENIYYITRIYKNTIYQSLSDFLFEFGMPEQETLIYLSALRYESKNNYSKMMFEVDEEDVDLRITLEAPVDINLNNARSIRKLMEIATKDFCLEVCAGRVTSIVKLLRTSRARIIEFEGNLNWKVAVRGHCMVEYKEGEICLPNLLDKHKYIQNTMYKHFFEKISKEQMDKLCQTIECVSIQKHGTSIIISDDAKKEVDRLYQANRVIKIKGINILDEESVIEHITSIDGAFIIDLNCICYGIGMIVDGEAIVQGDSSRGARYNSIYNYIVQKYIQDLTYMAVIISEDGMVDIISTEIDKDNFKLLTVE